MAGDARTPILRAVREALDPHERVVLAVSGGIDSMVLLRAAVRALPRERIIVATFDHGTGRAATEAARAVERAADEYGVRCTAGRAASALSSEAELRVARWAFLRAAAAAWRAVVATAHTESDQVETVLMRVMRDAGARGLAGLYAKSDIVRPLLSLTRAQIADFARAGGVTWVEDPSNASRRYLRNRVRHDLLPALRAAHPQMDAELLRLARAAAELRVEVEDFVAVRFGLPDPAVRHRLDVAASLLASRSVDELSLLWPAIAARAGATLDRRGTARLVAFTRGSRVGARIQLAGGWEVVRSRDALQLRASPGGGLPPRGSLSSTSPVAWGDWSFRPSREPVGGDPMTAWLPLDQSLSVRSWRAGDTMVARAGGPVRKVKQLLSRAGITGHDRAGWPVVLAGEEIVWIPGVRRADAAAARSGRPGLPFVCEHHRR